MISNIRISERTLIKLLITGSATVDGATLYLPADLRKRIKLEDEDAQRQPEPQYGKLVRDGWGAKRYGFSTNSKPEKPKGHPKRLRND